MSNELNNPESSNINDCMEIERESIKRKPCICPKCKYMPQLEQKISALQAENERLKKEKEEIQNSGFWGRACARLQKNVQELESVKKELDEAIFNIELIMPLAKGYAYKNDIGGNRSMVKTVEDFLHKHSGHGR